VLLSTKKLTFNGVTALIRQEATRRVAMATSDLNPKPEAQDFTARHFNVGRAKGKKEIGRCTHCKKDCHTQDKCWVLHPHLRPKRIERNQSEEVKRRDFAQTLNTREGRRGLWCRLWIQPKINQLRVTDWIDWIALSPY
jgi:hypothetical protein